MHKYNIQSMTIELYFQQNKRVASEPVEAHYIKFKKPFGLEKSSPPNVVGLQSVYIIKSAPPPATLPPSHDQT